MNRRPPLKEIYKRLYRHFGPQGWWPGDTAFEVIVGAILTQNTAWTNVEKAIVRLKRAGLLSSPERLRRAGCRRVAGLIRPAGYYNVKARRLKNFLDLLHDEYSSSIRRLSREPTHKLRRVLLAINGIGPETADSILLYAFGRPVFVIDAYTRRVLSRHRIIGNDADYHDMQALFQSNLEGSAELFNEYHALIVRLGKEVCKTAPRCDLCPLIRVKNLAKKLA